MCLYQVPAYKCVLLGEWTEGARVHPQAEFYGINETWWESWSALCVGVSTTSFAGGVKRIRW